MAKAFIFTLMGRDLKGNFKTESSLAMGRCTTRMATSTRAVGKTGKRMAKGNRFTQTVRSMWGSGETTNGLDKENSIQIMTSSHKEFGVKTISFLVKYEQDITKGSGSTTLLTVRELINSWTEAITKDSGKIMRSMEMVFMHIVMEILTRDNFRED
jgi:hypothetical protein